MNQHTRSPSRNTKRKCPSVSKPCSKHRTRETVSCAHKHSYSICNVRNTTNHLLNHFRTPDRQDDHDPIHAKRKPICRESKLKRSCSSHAKCTKCSKCSKCSKHKRCRHSPPPPMRCSNRCHSCHCVPAHQPIHVRPVTKTVFGEEKFMNVEVMNLTALPLQDTSEATVTSYAVINLGHSPIVATLEISPNGENFMDDTTEMVPPGAMSVLVPNRFLRYTRVTLMPSIQGGTTHANVYYQYQTLGYEGKDR